MPLRATAAPKPCGAAMAPSDAVASTVFAVPATASCQCSCCLAAGGQQQCAAAAPRGAWWRDASAGGFPSFSLQRLDAARHSAPFSSSHLPLPFLPPNPSPSSPTNVPEAALLTTRPGCPLDIPCSTADPCVNGCWSVGHVSTAQHDMSAQSCALHNTEHAPSVACSMHLP